MYGILDFPVATEQDEADGHLLSSLKRQLKRPTIDMIRMGSSILHLQFPYESFIFISSFYLVISKMLQFGISIAHFRH